MDMTVESRVDEHKATVRRMLARLSAGDVQGFVDSLVPNYVRHCQAMPAELQEIRGRDVMRDWLLSNQVSFPDWREEIDQLVGEGDFVAWRSRGTGTLVGPLGPFPPTNRRMEIVIIGMHRFEGGLVAETWTSWDNVSALTQLGLLPAP
jgi:predicted ester cyclase